MKWLRALKQTVRGRNAMCLPEILHQRLAERSFSAIQPEVQRLLSANPHAPEFDQLRTEVKRYDWPASQIEKLEAYADYYRGAIGGAFMRASRYCSVTDGAQFDADLFILATLCLFHNNQYEEAYLWLSTIGDNESQMARRIDYHNIKSSICLACGRLEEARVSIDQARRLDPDDPLSAFNAYALYFELGDLQQFEQLRAEIAAGRYGSDGNALERATCELALDRYTEGFRLLERRYDQADAVYYCNPALPKDRRWRAQGLDLPTDETLLITCEQGFGDSIMMARYLPLLRERLKDRLVMEVQPEALTLLQHNFPAIPMVPREHGHLPLLAFNRWTGSMSLPYLFGSEPGRIPGTAGYISVPPDSRDYWARRVHEQVAADRPRIGLAWSGNLNHRSDRRRSIPFTLIRDHLDGWSAHCFFALQTVVPTPCPPALIDVSDELITLADTAALIAEMDLIITVDTSIVHLAGALGCPTWLLLPYRYEWRWGLEGEKNNWYDTVRILRQETHGDWDGLLKDVLGPRLFEFNNTTPILRTMPS
jgi:tetratricopeptide (TPR) repeat protein